MAAVPGLVQNVRTILDPTTASLPLLNVASFVYAGACKVPHGSLGDPNHFDGFSYGGSGFTYVPSRNSFYIVGSNQANLSGELGMPPAFINSSKLSDLKTAPLLQGLKDGLEGKINMVDPVDPNSKRIGAQIVANGQLYISAYSYYDATGHQVASTFIRPINLSVTGQVTGPYRIGNLYPSWTYKYQTPIPPEWQAAFGGGWLAGGGAIGNTAASSYGPTVSVFNLSQLGPVPAPSTLVLGYPNAHQTLGGWGQGLPPNPLYNMMTEINAVVFVPGTRSVLFYGRTGMGRSCYGPGTTTQALDNTVPPVPPFDPADRWCYDLDVNSKGTHAYPYAPFVWAYDANELLAVRNGVKQPWQVVPYATWIPPFPFIAAAESILGASYDEANKRIFLCQSLADNTLPVIHAFSVN